MLEKIKQVPFIDESSAVKVTTACGKVVLERNDRVVWAKELTAIPAENINCYVEAEKFFALAQDIKSLEQTTCLVVTLKNNAKYELPFLDVSWDTLTMPTEYSSTVTFKLADLMLCTLKNLVKPELQCIYIDQEGAVTCDFISACVSKTVKANKPFLLPPDVQELVDGRMCKVEVTEDKIYIQSNDFSIVTSKPTMSEDAWWDNLRGMLDESRGALAFADATKLVEGLKRLALFSDYVAFDGEKVIAGDNYEPFPFVNTEDKQYEIERVAKILTTANKITVSENNLVLKNDSNMFLISPAEEV